MSTPTSKSHTPKSPTLRSKRRRSALRTAAFLSPWLIGFTVFFAYPLLSTVYFSFMHYDGFKPPTWASNGGVGSPSTASREEQIRVAENVLRTQGLRAWPKCGTASGGPAVWNASSPMRGCGAMRGGAVLGIVDLRSLCSTFLSPFGLG